MGNPLKRENKMANMTEHEAKVLQSKTEHKAKIELFQAVATFGWMSAAVFCLGGPLILCFAPGLSKCFRHTMIVISGIAGFAIAACVLVFYCLLARPTQRAESADEG